MTSSVSPTTTVTYTGAALTSYLLHGGSPTTLAGTNGAVISSNDDGGNDASASEADGSTESPTYAAGNDYFSSNSEWPGYDGSSTSTTFASQTDSPTASASESSVVSASSAPDTSTDTPSVSLNTPEIIAIVVGTVGLLAVIALVLFLLARHKRAKDRQRLRDTASDEKLPSNPPSPARPEGPMTPANQTGDPFSDDKAVKHESNLPNPNPRRQQDSVITNSFDFGGLVPTKNNYGKDGKPLIAPVWDERDVGRPFAVTRPASPPGSMVAEVGDETSVGFASRSKTPSPTKDSAGVGSQVGTPQSGQTVSSNSSITRTHLAPTASLTRKVNGQERQLPISRPISPFDDGSSISSNASSLRVAPQPIGMVRSPDSSNSIASTSSINRRARPAPIQVLPPKNDSRDSIVIDKTASPPMTEPPSIPTPPLPSLEFRKEWERLKRDSGDSIDSTDTQILDGVDDTADTRIERTTKGPLQPKSDAINLPPPVRNESLSKMIPRTLLISSPKQAPANGGDLLKVEKTMLRVPSSTGSIASSSNSSISSATGPANPNNKRSPSIVAATAKWAEKRKALNAALAKEHNAREARAARNDPLPNNAVEKVEEARKSLQGLVPSPSIEEGRDTSARKREVEGRKGMNENATESVGSPTLSVFKCYDPERESTFVPGEALNMIRALQLDGEDKENMPIYNAS